MTTLSFRRPVALPLYRRGAWPYTPPDPRADDGFEITQQFADIDWYWRDRDIAAGRTPRTHSAVDMGNYACGGVVVAVAPGVASRVVDPSRQAGAPTDALGVRIDHGSGITTEYWHLNGWTIPATPTQVTTGQQIGIVGSTGLGGACHLHFELKRDGVRIDPEPYLFGAELDAEDDVLVSKTQPLQRSIRVVTGAGNSIRTDTRLTPDTYEDSTDAGAQFTIVGFAAGDVYQGSDRWYVFLKRGVGLRAIHSTLCQTVPEPKDCAAEVAAAAAEQVKRVDALKGDAAQIVPILERMRTR